MSDGGHPLLTDEVKSIIEDLKSKLEPTESMVLSAAGAIAPHNISPSLWKKYTDDTLVRETDLQQG